EWNAELRASSVTGFGSYAAADKNLGKLVGPTSPLLEFLYFIAHNTDVAPADAKTHFAPVSAVEPAGPPDTLPDRYVLPPNKDYIDALVKLQSDVHALAQSQGTPDPALVTAATTSADGALQAGTKTGDPVPGDHTFKNQDEVTRLLEEPIKRVEDIQRGMPAKIAGA